MNDGLLFSLYRCVVTAYLAVAEIIHAEVAFVADTVLLPVRSLSHLLPWHQD